VVGVGDRNGEGVGGVGAGDLHTGKEPLDHGVDLRLVRSAGADDGFLDQPSGIFADFDTRAGGNHQHDAARLGELEGRLRILVEKDFLRRGRIGGVVGEERLELRGKVRKAARQGFLGVRLELAIGEMRKAITLGADQAVAGRGQRRVKTKNDQPKRSITSSETS